MENKQKWTKEQVLKKCPLFRGIADQELGAMLACMKASTRTYRKGEVILLEGDPATHLGVVLSGRVTIVRNDYYGNTTVVHTKKQGQLFGEAFACSSLEELPVSVEAAEDSEVMLIDARRIMNTCENGCGFHQQLIFNLLQIVAQNNVFMNQKMDIITKKTTKEKLMAYLMTEAKAQGSTSFDIDFDRQQLADYLGVERSAMSTELSKLARAGYLTVDRRHFTILKELEQ